MPYRCCRHCREWEGPCPESGHVVPCVGGCELGAQLIRPLVWTTSGLRMVAE